MTDSSGGSDHEALKARIRDLVDPSQAVAEVSCGSRDFCAFLSREELPLLTLGDIGRDGELLDYVELAIDGRKVRLFIDEDMAPGGVRIGRPSTTPDVLAHPPCRVGEITYVRDEDRRVAFVALYEAVSDTLAWHRVSYEATPVGTRLDPPNTASDATRSA